MGTSTGADGALDGGGVGGRVGGIVGVSPQNASASGRHWDEMVSKFMPTGHRGIKMG